MTDLKLGSDHDITIVNGDLALTTDNENVIQELDIRLQFFKGEWFLNILEGILYIDEIFVKGIRLNEIKAIFVKEILASDRIEELLSLELSHESESRGLRVDFSARADSTIITDSILITI